MQIRIEMKSTSNSDVETTHTTLEQFLRDDDGIGEDEAAKITRELNTTGHSRVAGFVGIYADIYRTAEYQGMDSQGKSAVHFCR